MQLETVTKFGSCGNVQSLRHPEKELKVRSTKYSNEIIEI